MGLATFHLLPQRNGGLGFGLPNAPSNSQARGGFNRRTTPVFPWLIAAYSVFSAFLRPTYVHIPSISTRLIW